MIEAPNSLLACWNRVLHRRRRDVAVMDAGSDASTTFGELDAAAEREASRLTAALGELRGRIVVFARANGADWLALFLALRKTGAVAVAIEPGGPDEHALQTADRLGARAWLAGAQLVPLAGRRRFHLPDLCLLKLTSGSTGAPRALPFTDAEMLADGRQVVRSMGLRRADVNFASIPFGHSYGLGNLVLPLLADGLAVVCGTAPLPYAVAAEMTRFRPTVWPAVPAMLRALAASGAPAAALASLRTVISAGSFLPPEVARAFHARFGHIVHNFYGSSETGGIAYDRRGDATLSGRAVGSALHGVRLRLSRTGRVLVTSAAAYSLGNRRGRGQVLLMDYGRFAAGGELVLLGRAGRFAKIAGRRIGFGEIELALRELRGVEQVYVTALPGPEPVLAAAVVTARRADELRAELRGRFPRWKIPKRLLCLPALPLTARGKPDTVALTRTLAGGGAAPRDRKSGPSPARAGRGGAMESS